MEKAILGNLFSYYVFSFIIPLVPALGNFLPTRYHTTCTVRLQCISPFCSYISHFNLKLILLFDKIIILHARADFKQESSPAFVSGPKRCTPPFYISRLICSFITCEPFPRYSSNLLSGASPSTSRDAS